MEVQIYCRGYRRYPRAVTEMVVIEGSVAQIQTPLYVLGMKRYDQLRHALDNISRRNQRERTNAAAFWP
jgi:hypothetical protein